MDSYRRWVKRAAIAVLISGRCRSQARRCPWPGRVGAHRAGLLFAFAQHDNAAQTAHLDRVGDAYARFFTRMREALREADRSLANARRFIARPLAKPDLKHKALEEAERHLDKLPVAATELLLLEGDSAMSKRIVDTSSRWGQVPSSTHESGVPHLDDFINQVRERQVAIERLYTDAVERLRGRKIEPLVPPALRLPEDTHAQVEVESRHR